MVQNPIQFQKGMSFPDFPKQYGTEQGSEKGPG